MSGPCHQMPLSRHAHSHPSPGKASGRPPPGRGADAELSSNAAPSNPVKRVPGAAATHECKGLETRTWTLQQNVFKTSKPRAQAAACWHQVTALSKPASPPFLEGGRQAAWSPPKGSSPRENRARLEAEPAPPPPTWGLRPLLGRPVHRGKDHREQQHLGPSARRLSGGLVTPQGFCPGDVVHCLAGPY